MFLSTWNRWFDVVIEYLEKIQDHFKSFDVQQSIYDNIHKCISDKELDLKLELVCVWFTFLTPLLQNRKRLFWIFGIDHGFACE